MASCNTSNYTNILDLPQALDIAVGDFLIVEKPDEGTYILDFSDFIITLENTTFAPLLYSIQTQITQISAITQAFVNNLSGSNILVGIGVGTNITTGLDNIAIGKSAMSQGIVVGIGNVGIGKDTLDKLTDGTYNIGIGREALTNLTTGDSNIAIGQSVMSQGNVISDDNIAIGKDVLDKLNTGTFNIGIGREALTNLTSGSYNVGVGASVMSLSTVTGNSNVAIGLNTARKISTGNHNVAIGSGIMFDAPVTGDSNVGVGINGLNKLSTGTCNVALGRNCAGNLTTGFSNVAIGTEVMFVSAVTGEFNVAVGARTMDRLTNGSGNVGVGSFVMNDGDIGGGGGKGNYNTAMGYNAMSRLASGTYNVGIGASVMSLGSIVSAGILNDPNSNLNGVDLNGGFNVAVGINTLDNLTSGTYNLALGTSTLQSITNGSFNVALGHNCMSTSSSNIRGNIGIGESAASYLDTGADYNIAIGTNACERLAANSDYNVGIGFSSLGSSVSAVSGTRNVGVGHYAGSSMLSGRDCIFIGTNSGVNTQNTRGASDIICIGQNTGFFSASSIAVTNSVAIGFNALINRSNQIVLGNGSSDTFVKGGVVQTISDARDKVDIRDSQLGLNFISKLRPVEYRYDLRENYYDRATNTFIPKDGSLAGKRYHQGLVAQEVKQAADELSVDFDGYQDMKVNGGADVLSLGYSSFIAPLIKAVQELSTQNQELLSRIEVLESAS